MTTDPYDNDVTHRDETYDPGSSAHLDPTGIRRPDEDPDMLRDPGDRTVGEKVGDAANELAGKAKRGWGDMTDDERLEDEGRRQEAAADQRQAADREADRR